MAEGLARKKRIRAGHKASATRMLNRIDELLKAEEVDKAQLAQLKMSLTEKLETVKLLDGEILELTEEVDLDDEILQADTYKNNIYQAMVKLDKAAKDAAPPPTETPPTPLSARDTSTTRDYRIKLPKLTIPSFDGDVAQWTSFWDSYDSAVHQNPSLNEVDKFNYLRSFLKGAARDAVSGLMLTAANYQEAIEILKRRFGNRQRIISRHMDIMMNADSVTSHNNVKALRQLYDVMESNVRSLKSFGVTSESYGSLLASILMNKLPSELRLIISRKIGDDDWDFGVILKELLTEVEARERTSSNQANPSSQDKRPSRGQHTVATLQSSNSNPHCSFCGQSHPSERCETVREPEERKQVLLKAGRCFVCLRRGHLARQCRTKVRCSMCGGRHNTAICSKSATPRELEDGHTGQPRNVNSQSTPLNPRAPSFQAPPSHTPTTSSLFVGAKDAVLLQTARVRVYDPDKPDRSMEFRAILDTGSQQSYATQRVKDSLAVQAREKRMMSIMTFGSGERKTQEYDVIKIGVVTLEGENQEMELSTVPLVCQPLLSQPIDLCKSAYQHLHDLELADSLTEGEPMEVDLLIGVDYYWRFVTGDTRRGEGGPVAIRTRLGWVLSGPTAMQMDNTAHTYLTTHVLRIDASPHSTQRLEEVLQSFWHLESLGIEDKEGSILDKFSQSIHFKGGHYEVTLPWKSSHPLLPDNLGLSQKRLEGLLQRLKQKPDIMGEYDTIIKRQLQQGIVEEVCQPDGGIPGRVHYLPHHAVVRKDKDTTKVRVVYDASAKATGCSLNECLHKGPKFEQKILEILLRFRTYQVALTSDIEKAFLMVSVSECDRDVLRFLWVEDVNKEPPEIRVLRFARVVFGVSCSPFLLNATLQHHLSQYRNSHLELVEKLTKSMYVDDVISGAQSEEEAYQLYSTSKKILKDGGFNLRKFATNSSSLQQRINSAEETHGVVEAKTKASDSDETYSNATLGTNQSILPGEQKVLGVRWEIRSDRLCFSFEDIAHLAMTLEPTKRHLVSIVGRFYDPMGYLSPIVIRFKILLQELCRERQDWDQQLTGGLLQKWNNLIQELRCSSTMYLPRCLWTGLPTEDRTCSLYGFCDASKQAYAAVVYLVVKSPSGSSVRFLVSKTRVAPLKSQTIPRLELLSAVLLSRLMRSVTDGLGAELNLSQPHCFTDSKVALYWILGEERVWKQFVQHRVLEVRSVLPGDRWKHCPGTENPAELPSRGLPPMELAGSSLWTNGPEWMGRTTESNQFQEIEMPQECAIELRAKDQPAVVSLIATSNSIDVGQIIDCDEYSCLHKLLRVTGLMLQFTAILKSKINPAYKPRSNYSMQAEVLWVKVAQKKLTENGNFERLKKQFKLFCDEEGIWRCGGRLENASVPFHE